VRIISFADWTRANLSSCEAAGADLGSDTERASGVDLSDLCGSTLRGAGTRLCILSGGLVAGLSSSDAATPFVVPVVFDEGTVPAGSGEE